MAKITDYLQQDTEKLIALRPCILKIDLTKYGKEDMDNQESVLWLKSLISTIEFDDRVFDLVLDYAVFIQKKKFEYSTDKKTLKVFYTNNDILLTVSEQAADSTVQVSYLERLIGGREILKDATHLLNKLFALYGGSISTMDLVHLEILCAQVLRDRANPQQPARLAKKWDPILMNLKKVVFNEGFINSLAFENINEAIKMGLISDEVKDPSIIEKILTGTLVDK